MSENLRTCSAGETFSRVSPHLSRLGITRIARQTGLDRIGVPVWCAYAPNSKAIVIAQGKGLDDASAKTSAVMEAIERSVATQPACATIVASQRVLAERHALDALAPLLATGSQPIGADEQVEWVEALDLVRHAPIFLPFDAVHLDRARVNPRFWISSDGLASGNVWEEAVLHGLLERIERDACALWDVGGSARRYARRIDPRSIEDDRIAGMLESLVAADFDLALFDVTSDLSIAAVVAMLRPAGGGDQLRHVDVTLGAGASPCPKVAASRAISEAVQSRMTFIAGARDDLVPDLFSRRVDPMQLQAFAAPMTIRLTDIPEMPVRSTREALAQTIERLAGHGIDQLYAVELAPEWLPASVVKVFAPQLEHPDGDRRIRFGSRAMARSFA